MTDDKYREERRLKNWATEKLTVDHSCGQFGDSSSPDEHVSRLSEETEGKQHFLKLSNNTKYCEEVMQAYDLKYATFEV